MSNGHGPEPDWKGALQRLEELLSFKLDGRTYLNDRDIQFIYGEAVETIIANARHHGAKLPSFAMLLEEVNELALALEGNHEHPPEYELTQIGGIVLNWLQRLFLLAETGEGMNGNETQNILSEAVGGQKRN